MLLRSSRVECGVLEPCPMRSGASVVLFSVRLVQLRGRYVRPGLSLRGPVNSRVCGRCRGSGFCSTHRLAHGAQPFANPGRFALLLLWLLSVAAGVRLDIRVKVELVELVQLFVEPAPANFPIRKAAAVAL